MHPHVPIVVVFLLALGIGVGCGVVNGAIVTIARVPSLVVTLGTLYIIRGIDGAWAGGNQVNASMLPEQLQQDRLRHVPRRSVPRDHRDRRRRDRDLLRCAASAPARDFYAIGSNPEAARLAGIPVGVARLPRLRPQRRDRRGHRCPLAVATTARSTRSPASGYEFQVIAAVVVGGVAIFGGSGTVLGAALGALLLNTIDSALVVVNVSSFWSAAIAGGAAHRRDRLRPADRAARRARPAHAKEEPWLSSTTQARRRGCEQPAEQAGESTSASSCAGRRSCSCCSAARSLYGASVSPYFLHVDQPLLHLPERGRGRDHGAAAHADRDHRRDRSLGRVDARSQRASLMAELFKHGWPIWPAMIAARRPRRVPAARSTASSSRASACRRSRSRSAR